MESVGTYLSIRRDWRSQVGEAGFAVVGPWDAGPIDFELARFFGDADVFCSLQANGIDKGIGHVGERDGATEGDAALASELHESSDKGADLVDFGDFAQFGGEFDEGIDRRRREGITAAVCTAENFTEFGDRLTALTATLIDVTAECERVNLLMGAFHSGTPLG
jgi:hypothetical protein